MTTPRRSFRYSDRFIRIATAVLIIAIVGGLATGITLGVASDSVEGEAGERLGIIAAAVVIGSIVSPLLIAAVLGGEAIKRGGGLVGLLLVSGMVAGGFGWSDGGRELIGESVGSGWVLPIAIYGGVAIVLAVVLFWVIGWVAKVPMWLQGPSAGSPRLIVRGTSDDPDDVVLPNELDGRSGRHRKDP